MLSLFVILGVFYYFAIRQNYPVRLGTSPPWCNVLSDSLCFVWLAPPPFLLYTTSALPCRAISASCVAEILHSYLKSIFADPTLFSLIDTSHVPCKFFRQGACQAGAACPFSHDLGAAAENVCKYFAKVRFSLTYPLNSPNDLREDSIPVLLHTADH